MDRSMNMNYGSTCQNQKGVHHHHHHSSRLNKKRLTQDQVRLLEVSFNCNKKLEPDQKLELAKQLGVAPRQIAIWYQNKRARWKNQSLELDYGVLQLRLETALADKRQLEKQVQHLQDELQKAQENLLAVTTTTTTQLPPPPQQQQNNNDDLDLDLDLYQDQDQLPPPNFSDCYDEGGGGTSSCSWETGTDQDLKLDDLYACLMGASTEGSSSAKSHEINKFSFF